MHSQTSNSLGKFLFVYITVDKYIRVYTRKVYIHIYIHAYMCI